MGKLKFLIVGIIVGATMSACATIFPWKYYSLDAVSFEGSLRGPKPADDLDLKICTPSADDKSPCLVMKTRDFLEMKLEYLNLMNELESCQHGE